MRFYPACSVPSSEEIGRMQMGGKGRERMPMLFDSLLEVIQTVILMAVNDLIQKLKAAFSKLLYHKSGYLTQVFAFITMKNEY